MKKVKTYLTLFHAILGLAICFPLTGEQGSESCPRTFACIPYQLFNHV